MAAKIRKPAERFGVSLPDGLLEEFDGMIQEKGYVNRSQAIADMIRAELVDYRGRLGHQEIAGTITLVYDHHHSEVQQTLTRLQHEHLQEIITTVHVHLDHDNCLEILVVRGKSRQLKRLADELIAAKGVKHGRFSVTSLGAH